MKKLMILCFLFVYGVCFSSEINEVYAASVDSKSSIYFTETYVYEPTPEVGKVNGVTPTGNPPKSTMHYLPKTGESSSGLLTQISGMFFLGLSIVLKKLLKVGMIK